MGSNLLELNNFSSEGKFDSDSNSLVELDLFFHKNKVNRLKNSGKTKGKKAYKYPKFDVLLYDTESTNHIINDRKWFIKFNFDKGELPVLITGGDLIMP